MQVILETIKSYATTSVLGLIFSAICALIFILIGFKLSGAVVKLFKKSKTHGRMDPSVASFLCSFINVGLKILVIIVAATIVGINAVALSTILGTLGVTAGLALQGSLGNLIGGLMILFFHPFKVGDYIDNHTDAGTVCEIGIFYTTIHTIDNKRITIPNGLLSNATVINYSAEPLRRVDLEFTAAYATDIDKVVMVMQTVYSSNAKILTDPAPFAGLIRQDADALVFISRTWVKSEDYWDVYFDLQEKMKKAFDAVGIVIPFRQMDVHLDK